MLDRKDQVLLEYLMHNCRLSTVFLSRAMKLSQSTVVYRIKRLERKGYISKYDALVNWPMLPIVPEIFFITVPVAKKKPFEDYATKNEGVSAVVWLLHQRNYCAVTFLRASERTEFVGYLEKNDCAYEGFAISREEFMPFSIFDVAVSLPKKRRIDVEKIELDEKDIKITKILADGGGRDSVLQIARKTGISYDVVLYRFRKLVKCGFFPLFLAQPSPDIFGLQVDMLIVRTRSTTFRTAYEIFAQTKKSAYCVTFEEHTFFTQIFTKSLVEYKQTLEKILEGFGDDILEWRIFNTKGWLFINRTPFEKLIEQ